MAHECVEAVEHDPLDAVARRPAQAQGNGNLPDEVVEHGVDQAGFAVDVAVEGVGGDPETCRRRLASRGRPPHARELGASRRNHGRAVDAGSMADASGTMSPVNCTLYNMNDHIETPTTGTTSQGVPYLLIAPRSGASDAPLVVAWHLLDPPRTEAAFAAALPLDGLDAWRLYLGLPMSGSRTPEGGMDAVFGLHGPGRAGARCTGRSTAQAVAEAPAAIAEVRERAGIADGVAVGLMGGSMGGAIVAELLATRALDARAAVLLNPLLELRPMIDAVVSDVRRLRLDRRPAMPPPRASTTSAGRTRSRNRVRRSASSRAPPTSRGSSRRPRPSPTPWGPTCSGSTVSRTRSPRSRASNRRPRRTPRVAYDALATDWFRSLTLTPATR